MPSTKEIKVYLIAKTEVDWQSVEDWLRELEVSDEWRNDLFSQGASEPAFQVALAAKRCYKSFEPGLNPNVTRVRREIVEYLDNVMASGHGSVLEHAVFSLAIENVTRVFTAEMNRHRAGWAISEGSMRFIRFSDSIPFWMPDSFQIAPDDPTTIIARKEASRDVFMRAFESTEGYYRELEEIWDMDQADKNFSYKKAVTSALRRIVPMGVCTGGVWTGNARALRHVLALRTEPAAEEEIAHAFDIVAGIIMEACPELFGDFEPHDLAGGRVQWKPKFRKV